MALLMEMGWGGLVQYPWSITWTDVSSRLDMVQGVSITRGAQDELSDVQPASMSARLDNQDGALTPGNPNSPYWPFVRRNTPVRVAVTTTTARTGAAPWSLAQLADDFDDDRIDTGLWPNSYGGAVETGGRARIPVIPGGFAAYQTARSWLLAGSQLSLKIATLPGVSGSSAASVSVMVNSTTAGTRCGFTYSPLGGGTLRLVSETGYFDGSATVLTYSAIDHVWLRIRESAGTLRWETSGDGTTWTTQRTLATPAWVTSQQVAVEMVANRTGGAADFCEFDLVGHRPRWRFHGTLNDLPVSWNGLVSTVTVTATDLFKRLNRLPALKSCLAEEIMSSVPVGYYRLLSAYFPMAEETGATAAGDLSGRGAGAIAQTQVGAGGTIEFGAAGLPATGDTCVTFTPASASAGRYLTGDLGALFQSDSNATPEHTVLSPMIEVWIKTSTAGRAILGLYEPGLDHRLVLALNGSGVLTVEHTEDGGSLTTVTTASANLADGAWHHIVHDNAAKTIWVDGVQIGGSLAISTQGNARILHVGGYGGGRLWSGQIAHLAIHHANGPLGAVYADHYTAGTTGYAGETAALRIARLARYAGLTSVTVWGFTHDPVASQGEGGTGVLPRMREVEATESARLFAERDYFGLAYQSRDIRYNPSPSLETFTSAYADLETGGVELADDDQKLCNAVEASRPGGATQRATASASVLAFGLYEQQLTLLKMSDNSVLDAAYWQVSRYANPQPELREATIEAYTHPRYSDILDADISSYFSINDLPVQAPASSMRVTIEGYSETIREASHVLAFRTSTSARDSVWVLDDPTYSVLDYTTRLGY
ncbi:LamG-like jellyroll fold domain-containing protein [Streptomyces sp. NPDC059255]|uniref:LamG-like jellyroll fold domain-containing protein n=1 Tax=Streptomyces sp. NPDC059255 TaxID=3346793 RepID=UPI0036B23386